MEMSSQVQNMQNPGGRLFGAIDVVISAGTGRNFTHDVPYLETPQRLAAPPNVLLENGEAPGNETVPDSNSQGLQHSLMSQVVPAQMLQIKDSPYLLPVPNKGWRPNVPRPAHL